MLNGGAIISKNRRSPGSRINTARDREEINQRYRDMNSYIVESLLQERCNDSGVLIQDYAVAAPVLVGYDKIVIGPTKRFHLDVLERLLDSSYFQKIVKIHASLLEKLVD